MAGTSLPPSVLEGGLCSLPLHQGWLWAALTNREWRARGPNHARAHKGLGQGEGGLLPEAGVSPTGVCCPYSPGGGLGSQRTGAMWIL